MDTFRQSLPRRSFWDKALPWLSAALLAAGVIVLILKLFPSSSGVQKADQRHTQSPQTVAPNGKTVPLEPAARRVAGKFILTAVQRKNLEQAYSLAGPEIRQGMSLKEWSTGNIAVIPFLDPIDQTRLKVDYSVKNQAIVEVQLIPKTKSEPGYFFLELRRVGKAAGAHWIVWSWVPRGSAAIPVNPSQ
jgi:hypothetical protein